MFLNQLTFVNYLSFDTFVVLYAQLFILLEKIKSWNKIITEGEYTIKRHAPNMSQFTSPLCNSRSQFQLIFFFKYNKNTELAKWPRDQLPYYQDTVLYNKIFGCLLNGNWYLFTLLTRWKFQFFFIYLTPIWLCNNAIIINGMSYLFVWHNNFIYKYLIFFFCRC